jgi:NIMA (never in mitosis gene a)-related kinase
MNIFIGKGQVVKVGDMGISKVLANDAAAKTCIGTPHYMAPEVWRDEGYDYSADVWSIGCTLYELLTYRVSPYRVNPSMHTTICCQITELYHLAR